ncbi:MAG: hypothetical protein OHK0029_09390 [Armatimonadaceae bacterium]
MKSKKAKSASPSASQGTSQAASLPDIATAQTEFTRRHIRLWIALLLRVVGLGILTAILTAQVPFLAQNRPLLDAISGVLALAPLFTGLGRLHGWRIALGRRYAEAQRWHDALTILEPLRGITGRLFDANGEGRYWLAEAYHATGRASDAEALRTTVANLGSGEWAEKAKAAQL